MNRITLGIAAAFLLGAMAPHAVCHAQRSLVGSVKIDGSSTVFPITEAVAEEFAEVAPRVRVTVGISGTGGGFKRFTVGETDISDASRPIKPREHQEAEQNGIEYIEIPVAYDGLSIVVNPKNYWCDSLTVEDLRRIFLDGSTVTTWQDVDPDYPPVPLKIYSPGTDSGTFDYFLDVVAGDDGAIRSDMSVSEDDNVLVRGVAGEEGAIGFFGCAYYFENKDKLKVVAIDGGEGPVEPTPETIEEGKYEPFSRPLFIYVNTKSAERPEVKAFVEFFFQEGPALAEEVGYVRLPEKIQRIAMKKWQNRETGSHFIGPDGEKKTGSLVSLYK